MQTSAFTPAYAAAVPDVDKPDDRVSSRRALAVILGSYLCFFILGIIRAIQLRDRVIKPTDFGTPYNMALLGGLLGEMFGAAVLLFLVCQWLGISGPLAGLPRRGASTVPSLLTTVAAFAGLIVASLALAQIRPVDPNALAGGAVHNGWTVPGLIIEAVNAGVVEEIVIVAIPVLLGRRAGWHPAVIVALSVLMRWPFHIYHGTWSSLPWAALWGGAHVLAYLYLRRLAPLVIYHVVKDAAASLGDSVCAALGWAVLGAYVALILIWCIRAFRNRQQRLAGEPIRRDPAAAVFLARRRRKYYPLTAAVLLLEWAVLALLTPPLPNRLTTALLAALVMGVVAAAAAAAVWLVRRYQRGINFRAYRADGTGEVQAVAAWSTGYTGTTTLSLTTSGRRTPIRHELDAIQDVVEATGQPVSITPSRDAYRVIAHTLHLPRKHPLTRHLVITPAQAVELALRPTADHPAHRR